MGGNVLAEPEVVALPRGMIVIAKPVNWEVDGLTSEGGGACALSSFLRRVLPPASWLARAAELDFGFVHRLDVPSSGLVLCGTSLEGLGCLRWQIAVYAVERHYVTGNHGRLRGGCAKEVAAPLDVGAVEGNACSSRTHEAGRPARSVLGSLAHFGLADPGGGPLPVARDGSGGDPPDTSDFSLLAIMIHTGRRHQIRVHTRHVGHPTATDARYTPKEVTITEVAQLLPSVAWEGSKW